MLITKTILLKPLSQAKYYSDLGYIFDKKTDLIEINVNHLPKSSEKVVLCECDVCGNRKESLYRNYIFNIKNYDIYTCNNKCAQIKNKMTNIKLYGNECANRSEIIKTKVENNNLEKYGVKYTSSLESVKLKTKESNIEKYGVPTTLLLDIVKEKIKETNLKLYGTEQYTSSQDFKNKSEATFMENYGVNNPLKVPEIREKILNTTIERYGVLHSSKSEIVKEKTKNTVLEKYGVSSTTLTENAKNSLKNNSLEKYGTEHHFKSTVVKNNIKINTLRLYGVDNISKSEHIKELKNGYYNDNMFEKYTNILSDDFIIINYIDKISTIKHTICGSQFTISNILLYSRINYNVCLCTECNPINSRSDKEKELVNWIKSLDLNIKENDRTILKPKELDIYLPEYKLAIEFNGVYWHSDYYKEYDYHYNKSINCKNQGINLFHIWEDEWIYKQDIIKSIILEKLNMFDNTIDINLCYIKLVDDQEIIEKFLNMNNINGYSYANINLGLIFNDELVSLMQFNNNELISFTNKINNNIKYSENILFEYFKNNYEYNSIISYEDYRMFDNNLYENLGFIKTKFIEPDFYWVNKLERNIDENINEEEMRNMNYHKLYNSGKYLWKCFN